MLNTSNFETYSNYILTFLNSFLRIVSGGHQGSTEVFGEVVTDFDLPLVTCLMRIRKPKNQI